jgi:mRNA interferase RelE/StbE
VTGGGYRTTFTQSARAEIRKLPRAVAMTILRKLTEMETDPHAYGTSALVSAPDIRRLRVGDYRVFYTVDRGVLTVTMAQVASRATAYD